MWRRRSRCRGVQSRQLTSLVLTAVEMADVGWGAAGWGAVGWGAVIGCQPWSEWRRIYASENSVLSVWTLCSSSVVRSGWPNT